MNGNSSYSKIIKGHDVANETSISMESSDLKVPAVPETTKPTSNPTPPEVNPNTQCSSELEEDDDNNQAEVNNNGEMMFDPKLRRNSSVSSAYALQLQVAVKRAFSMRRSCSVSESYSRIHDPYVTLTSPLDEHESDITSAGTKTSMKKTKKNKRDKILKAWKKFFGL